MGMLGGGFGGGGFGGGGFGGGGWRPGAPQAGLPFAGIPPELQHGVDALLTEEGEHDTSDVVFSHSLPASGARLSLLRLVSRYPHLLAAALALVGIVTVATQAGPDLTGRAIDDGMLPHRFGVVVFIAVLYLVAVFVAALGQRLQVMVTGRLASRVMYDLRIMVFRHLQRLSLDFYTEEKAGVIMSRMTSDIENLQQLLQDGLVSLITQGLTMIVITADLFTKSVKLAAVTLALVIPVLTVMSLWFRAVSERAYFAVRDGIANVLADLSESLQGMRVITATNRQARNIVHHRDIVGTYMDANIATGRNIALYGPGTQMVGVLAQGALLAVGGYMAVRGQLRVGELVAFVLYMGRFFQPIQMLVQQYNTFQQGQASVVKLRTLLETEPSVVEMPGAAALGPLEGDIVFDGVTFGYLPGVPVLSEVDLHVTPGETVAFVGPTGAGKSTLAKLVVRFHDPTAGRVLIDGHDLRSVTIDGLRRQLGVVPQEPFLFAGTIRSNVAFARPDAGDEEVWQALRVVGLEVTVRRMPAGLDEPVHERGQSLSSGERQLLALARAFHARPRVLVLDEATSNLDLASERRVERALDVLLEGRTSILIAHRLSTAMRADRIVVVDGGRVVESGTHDDLAAAGGRYADMYEAWTSQDGGGASRVAGGAGGVAGGAGGVAGGAGGVAPARPSAGARPMRP